MRMEIDFHHLIWSPIDAVFPCNLHELGFIFVNMIHRWKWSVQDERKILLLPTLPSFLQQFLNCAPLECRFPYYADCGGIGKERMKDAKMCMTNDINSLTQLPRISLNLLFLNVGILLQWFLIASCIRWSFPRGRM